MRRCRQPSCCCAIFCGNFGVGVKLLEVLRASLWRNSTIGGETSQEETIGGWSRGLRAGKVSGGDVGSGCRGAEEGGENCVWGGVARPKTASRSASSRQPSTPSQCKWKPGQLNAVSCQVSKLPAQHWR